MPMFDLEKADSVRLRACKTTSETMLKAHTVGLIDAADCEAGTATEKVKPSKLSRFKRTCRDETLKVIIGILITVIGGVIVAAYAPTIINTLL